MIKKNMFARSFLLEASVPQLSVSVIGGMTHSQMEEIILLKGFLNKCLGVRNIQSSAKYGHVLT